MDAESATSEVEPPAMHVNWRLVGGFCALALVTIALCSRNYLHQVVPEAGVTLDLPDHVDGFYGKDMPISKGEKEILPPDTTFAKKAYEDLSGDLINCQIVLSGGDKRSIHRPEVCLPGQGWNNKSSQTVSIPLASGRDLKVTQLTLTRMHEVNGLQKELTLLFLYWFVGTGYTTHDHFQRILHSNLDMLFHDRAHRWAYVIVSAPVLEGFKFNGKNEAQTLDMLKEFIPEIVPTFQKSEQTPVLPSTPVQ